MSARLIGASGALDVDPYRTIGHPLHRLHGSAASQIAPIGSCGDAMRFARAGEHRVIFSVARAPEQHHLLPFQAGRESASTSGAAVKRRE
jgi:hypothetical protein